MNTFRFGTVLIIIISLFSVSYILKSLKEFARINLSESSKVKGVILKSRLIESTDGRVFEMTIQYSVNGRRFEKFENLSIDPPAQLFVGDSLELLYNLDDPRFATAKKKSSLAVSFFVSVVLVLLALGSAVFWIKRLLYPSLLRGKV